MKQKPGNFGEQNLKTQMEILRRIEDWRLWMRKKKKKKKRRKLVFFLRVIEEMNELLCSRSTDKAAERIVLVRIVCVLFYC